MMRAVVKWITLRYWRQSVNDDILSVDGVAVFSLVSGSLRAGDTSGVIGSSQFAGNDG